MIGPSSSLDNQLMRFDGTSGHKVQVAPLTYLNDSGQMNLGQVAEPCSILELWDDDAHPILSLTAAHATDYDPQIQFRTGVTDTVKFSIGVDGADDKFKIFSGNGIGGTNEFVIDTKGNIAYMKADPYLDSVTNFFLGVESGGAGNLTHGTGSSGWYNIAVGNQALYSITSGFRNIAYGCQSLYTNSTGSDNVACGYQSLYSNSTGEHNIAFGYQSLYSNDDRDGSIAFGYESLKSSNAKQNIAFGYQSQKSNSSGEFNIACGYQSLYANTGGSYNVCFGYKSLNFCFGSDNIAIGRQAGDNIIIGDSNIIIGTQVDAPNGMGSNQLSIGNIIFATGVDGTGTDISSGNVGVKEPNPQDTLEVNGTILVKDKLKLTQDDGNEYLDSLADGYVDIGATTAVRINTDVLIANGKVLKNNSIQVLGAQQAHIVDADGTLGSATTTINAILAMLETHGLVASA